MEITKTLHVTTRRAFRAWLSRHHAAETEIWLVFHKRHTGKPRLAYEEAVEEALCFGWIDSLVKRIDGDRYAQKFTPRRPGSRWSALNLRRVRDLAAAARMTAAGLALVGDRLKEEPEAARPVPPAPVDLPDDFRTALEANPAALANWNAFAPGYRRTYLRWLAAAKREETRRRRIVEAVRLIARNTKALLK